MTYQQAVEDYNSRSSEDRVILLFALYGRAMFRAQVVEQQVVNMLAVHQLFTNPVNTHEKYLEVWDRYDFSKDTLGVKAQLINSIYCLSDQDLLAFQRLIALRNNLTHNYFRYNDNLFHSDSGQKQMIKDFISFIDLSEIVDENLMSYMDKYNKMAGVTDEKIKELFLAVKQEWSEREIIDNYDSTIKNN
jgi:hypothetical protein